MYFRRRVCCPPVCCLPGVLPPGVLVSGGGVELEPVVTVVVVVVSQLVEVPALAPVFVVSVLVPFDEPVPLVFVSHGVEVPGAVLI